jgi:hypothetical protein
VLEDTYSEDQGQPKNCGLLVCNDSVQPWRGGPAVNPNLGSALPAVSLWVTDWGRAQAEL